MATDVDTGGHIWFKCSQPCNGRCQYCDGGLALCTVCGAGEGELLSHCPGFRLSFEARTACYSGNVLDFVYLRRLKKHSPEAFREEMGRLNCRMRKDRS